MSTATATEYIVEVERLTKVFRDFWGRPKAKAVNGIDLRIRPGQVFGLLGPNGSGKSTTVKLILGLLYPTRGRIRVFGESPRKVAVKRRIGYQPEESYLYPYLTATETLDFFGSLLGIHESERRKRSGQLLEMVGLGQAGSRAVGEFSKGMARRLALAQALINDPDLVVLDEPTAGLDPIACREIKDVIRVLAERGKTVLLCSHLLADVEDVCDSLVVLYGGRIRAEGGVREILQIREQTRIVAPSLSNELIAQIKAVLKGRVDDCDLLIDHPRMSLEDFFLEVVRRAQSESMDTSGARVGGGVAKFLDSEADDKRDAGRHRLAELSEQETAAALADDAAMASSAAEAQSARQQVRQELLGELRNREAPVDKPGNHEKDGGAEPGEAAAADEAARRRASDKLRNLLKPEE